MPESKLEESEWAKVAAVVAGAGASAVVGSQIQKVLPQVTPEIAGAGAGLILLLYEPVKKAHRLVPFLGLGLVAGSLMPRVSGLFGGLVAKVGAGAAPTTTAPSTAYDAALAYVGGR